MKLSTKGTLWSVALIIIITVNAVLMMVAVQELRLTNRITAQDYEVALAVRNLRSLVVEYYVYGIDAGSKNATSTDRQMFSQARRRLLAFLQNNQAPTAVPELTPSLTALLGFEPKAKQTDPKAISLLNPAFREHFEAISGQLDELGNQSAALVQADRQRNARIADWLTIASVFMSLLAIATAIGRLIFLRRKILLPIQSLVETIKKVKQGDLSARWHSNRQDEIGVMGQTINETVAELERRRSERIQIMGTITHDLKNPLTAISMSCEFLLRKGSDVSKENALKLVKTIHTQVDRMKRMLEDLLGAVSALRPDLDLRINKVTLQEISSETLSLFRSAHPDRQYMLTAPEQALEIFADKDRLAQVLTNLISNATKYSSTGSDIELALSPGSRSAIIEVRDRGIGIPEHQLASVFQPFSRLEQGRKMNTGHGLGLAAVKNIVDAHHGDIKALTRPGGGTIFRIELPVAGPEQARLAG